MPEEYYKPIDCNFYDVLVLSAMRKQLIDIVIDGHVNKSSVIIKDIFTKNKEEFLTLSDGTVIRLDAIKTMADNKLYLTGSGEEE